MDSKNPSRYTYTSLNKADAEIRLLKIPIDVRVQLGRTTNLSTLSGTLKAYKLSLSSLSRRTRLLRFAKLPYFYALSYVWGTDAKTHSILIDGQPLAITKNLYDGIRSMQKVALGEFWIWADAICINQGDKAEVSQQILFMREIYHSAGDVRVYFGGPSENVRRCLEFIQCLADSAGLIDETDTENDTIEEFVHEALVAPMAGLTNSLYKVAQLGLGGLDVLQPVGRDDKVDLLVGNPEEKAAIEKEFEKIYLNWRPSKSHLRKAREKDNFPEVARLIDLMFLQHDWFTRMWVVQELGCATFCEILIGSSILNWEDFLQGVCYLHFTCNSPLKHISRIIEMEKVRLGWNDRKRKPLIELIRACRFRNATNPRDKIYSLYGLMGDQVYSNATRHFITQAERLDPICGWQAQPELENDAIVNLPSWTPNFNLDQELGAVPLITTNGEERIYAASGYDHHSKFSFQDSFVLNSPILHTTGLYIDTIQTISKTTSDEGAAAWLTTLLKNESLERQITAQVRSVLWDIALAIDQSSEGTRNDATDLKSKPMNIQIVKSFIQTLLCGRSSPIERTNSEILKDIIHHLQSPPISPTEKEQHTKIIAAFEMGMKRRKMAVTKNGYVGAVPECARYGDLIVVLFGCSVPVVLRAVLGEFQFVGECYLDGFMDAEAIVGLVRGQNEVRHFLLK